MEGMFFFKLDEQCSDVRLKSTCFCKEKTQHCKITGPILDIGVMGVFFRESFAEKKTFCLLVPAKQMSFLTISNETIFLKTQGTKLGAIVAPNKGDEQALNRVYENFVS